MITYARKLMELEIYRKDENFSKEKCSVSSVFDSNGISLRHFNFVKGNISSVTIDEDGTAGSDFLFYILSGKIEFSFSDKTHELVGNEALKIHNSDNFSIHALEQTEFLLFSMNPVNTDVDVDKLEKLLKKVNEKDVYTASHCYQVTLISEKLAVAINPKYPTKVLGIASHFHDIGKVNIPDAIINKPGRLTKEEFDEIKKHPIHSYNMLLKPYGEEIAKVARHHHEKLDGSGYPDGLKGDEISLNERILAVADVFDALTNQRSYRKGFSFEKALEIMRTEEKEHLDQDIIKVLEMLIQKGEIIKY